MAAITSIAISLYIAVLAFRYTQSTFTVIHALCCFFIPQSTSQKPQAF